MRAELARVRPLDRGAADPELLALVDDFFATQPSEDLPYSQAIHARGWLRAELGDPEGGLEELLACGEREQRWGVGTPQIIAWRSAAAEVCLTLGRLDAGARAGRRGAARSRARSARRARSASRCAPPRWPSRASGGSRCWSEAVASLAASQGALELARARIDLGRALVRAGRRDAGARAPARRAGARGPLRRDAARRARPPRAAGHRRPPAPHRRRGPRRAHAERAAGHPDGGRGPDQPRDRAGAVRDREDRRDPPRPRVREARRALAQAARGGASR